MGIPLRRRLLRAAKTRPGEFVNVRQVARERRKRARQLIAAGRPRLGG